MNSILALEEWKIASFDLKTTNTDEGTIENTTLDGTRYGIYTFVDYEYELKLEYLTKDELKGIEIEWNTYIKGDTKPSFATKFLEIFDFITHGDTQSNIAFIISVGGYKDKKNKLPGMFDLTLTMTHRVVF